MVAANVPLFEVAALAGVDRERVLGPSALGAAAEFALIAELLRRGHKVAVPVVDDDGVDLIVDYRTTVQVKFTTQTTLAGTPLVNAGRFVRRHSGDPQVFRVLAEHVDVVAIDAHGVGWFLVPRAVIGARRNVTLGPSMAEWRDAWSVFDAAC